MASRRKVANKSRPPKKSERLKGSDYVSGLLSFIPFLGVFFGIFSIYKGFTAKKIGGTALAILGFLGIAFLWDFLSFQHMCTAYRIASKTLSWI